jgi:RND family efflux transporter MFP subunit
MIGKLMQAARGKLVSAGLSLLGLILLLVWLEGGFASKVKPGHAPPDRPAASGTPVRASVREIDQVVARPGTVSSRTEAQVAPKLAARIEEITVRAGDRVHRGQLLVRLDDRSLQARLGQARAVLNAAQAEAVRARADARRTENLFHKEAATRQTLDTAVAAGQSAEAKVREAQSAVQEVETLFTETALKAPFDGVIVARLHEPGDTALAGTPILTLIEPGRLRVEIAVPESCLSGLHQGQSLTLSSRAAAHPQSATVEEISPSADPATHSVLVKARLAPDSGLTAGAFVWVEQICGKARVLLIPEAAVLRTGQLESVRLVRDGGAALRHVRTGHRHGDLIEILSGLQEGDAVLVGGT